MRLYDQAREVEEALSKAIDLETGEVLCEDGFLLFEYLEGELEGKVLSTAKYIKEEKLRLKALKEEKQRIDKMVKTLTNRLEWMEQYLLACWAGDKLGDEQVQIKRNIGQTVITTPEAIPEKFKSIEVKEEIKTDKKAIKAAILSGENVTGAIIKPTLGIK